MPCLRCGKPNGGAGYCAAHTPTKVWAAKPSSTRRGYDKAWRTLRAQILATNAQCHWCGGQADTVDHLVPISVDPTLRLEPSNCVPACRSCNSRRAAGRW